VELVETDDGCDGSIESFRRLTYDDQGNVIQEDAWYTQTGETVEWCNLLLDSGQLPYDGVHADVGCERIARPEKRDARGRIEEIRLQWRGDGAPEVERRYTYAAEGWVQEIVHVEPCLYSSIGLPGSDIDRGFDPEACRDRWIVQLDARGRRLKVERDYGVRGTARDIYQLGQDQRLERLEMDQNGDGTANLVAHCTYGDDGAPDGLVVQNSTPGASYNATYITDERGRIGEKQLDDNGNGVADVVVSYVRDSQGNLIQQEWAGCLDLGVPIPECEALSISKFMRATYTYDCWGAP
jgi:hypothetical protein